MQRPSPTKVILDTDPGVDDALALLLAFASPELQVVGVTTVCGNVPVGQATKNLFRLLNVVQPPPGLLVGQGAARPLEEDLVTAVQVHGSDGLGELDSVLAEEGTPRRCPCPAPQHPLVSPHRRTTKRPPHVQVFAHLARTAPTQPTGMKRREPTS